VARIKVGLINYERDCFVERAAQAILQSECKLDLTIWDNGSQNPKLPAIYARLAEAGATVIHNAVNEGLDVAQNKLLKDFFAGDCEHAFLLEDGCLALPWTIGEMSRWLGHEIEGDRRLGIVCCSLSQGPECQCFPRDTLPWDWVRTMVDDPTDDTPWNVAKLVSFVRHPDLIWNTVMAPDPFLWGLDRHTWEKTGEIDTKFWQGWGTLNDYSYRAREHRIHSVVIWNGFAVTWDRCVPRPWAENNPEERKKWEAVGTGRIHQKYGAIDPQDSGGWRVMEKNYKGMELRANGKLVVY
jgi:hypothetical protein